MSSCIYVYIPIFRNSLLQGFTKLSISNFTLLHFTQNAYHPKHAITWFISKHAEHNSYAPWLYEVPVTIRNMRLD